MSISDGKPAMTHIVVVVDSRAELAGGHVTLIQDQAAHVALSPAMPLEYRWTVLRDLMACQSASTSSDDRPAVATKS